MSQLTRPTWGPSVHHDGSPTYVTRGEGRTVTLRLRADREAPIERVFVRTSPDGEQLMTAMRRGRDTAVCQWWEAELPVSAPRVGYRFWLLAADGGWWLNAAGLSRHTPTDGQDFKVLAGAAGPSWLREAIFYQIFPDRFADGDPSNNVRTGQYRYGRRTVVARAWGEPPSGAAGPAEFYGGDLEGIIQRLPYLVDLGVTALYLNPIFVAPSNHKYDVADYENVDPHFGGNGALAALREALDERGMRLVLDIVPNHCGATHQWFTTAVADPHAPTADFFTFTRHPDKYESWLGVPTLPKLNYRSERLREVMYAGPDAIMRRWLRPPYRIDGWRIDVANMLARQGDTQLGHKIGRGVRRAIKAESPEAYLLGENFFDGTPHLQGDELDATMNYRGFTFPLLGWLAGFDNAAQHGSPWADTRPLPTEALDAQLTAFRAAVPWQIAVQQLNLLGSHDTPRVRSALRGDPALLRVATVLLFAYPGIPSIYYGDEVGLAGERDPDCRRCMPWDERGWDRELLELYRTLVGLRRSAPALLEGGFQPLHAAGETLAFLREARGQRLVVVVRRGPDGREELPVRHGGIPDGTRFREALSGAEATVAGGRLPLAGLGPVGVQLWLAEERAAPGSA